MSFFNRIVSLRPSRTVVTLLHWNFNLLFESSCKVFQVQVYHIFTLHWAANLSFKKSREFANLGKNDHIEFYVNLTSYFFQNNIRDRLPYEKKFIYDRIDTHKIYKGLYLWRYKKTSSQWMHIYFIRKNNTYLFFFIYLFIYLFFLSVAMWCSNDHTPAFYRNYLLLFRIFS